MRMRVFTPPVARAALALSLITSGTALAQQSGGSPGTTSGPAAGSPTTMGTGGTVPASPHQMEVLKNKGGAPIQGEKTSQGGPGQPGRPSAPGTEAGPASGASGQKQ